MKSINVIVVTDPELGWADTVKGLYQNIKAAYCDIFNETDTDLTTEEIEHVFNMSHYVVQNHSLILNI